MDKNEEKKRFRKTIYNPSILEIINKRKLSWVERSS